MSLCLTHSLNTFLYFQTSLMRSAAGFAQSLVRFSLVLVGFSFEFSCDAICRTMTRCFFASQSNYVFTACHFGREISLTRTRTFLGHTRTVSTLHFTLSALRAVLLLLLLIIFLLDRHTFQRFHGRSITAWININFNIIMPIKF